MRQSMFLWETSSASVLMLKSRWWSWRVIIWICKNKWVNLGKIQKTESVQVRGSHMLHLNNGQDHSEMSMTCSNMIPCYYWNPRKATLKLMLKNELQNAPGSNGINPLRGLGHKAVISIIQFLAWKKGCFGTWHTVQAPLWKFICNLHS